MKTETKYSEPDAGQTQRLHIFPRIRGPEFRSQPQLASCVTLSKPSSSFINQVVGTGKLTESLLSQTATWKSFWGKCIKYYFHWGTCLLVQWLRSRLPMQGTWVRSWVRKDPTCCGATEPMHHNCWAHVPQQQKRVRLRAHASQQEKQQRLNTDKNK